MPYPFVLPTTGSVLLSNHFDSVTHPSLPLAAATQRSVVRDALKQYKRLSPQAQPSQLPVIQDALTSYIAHLLTLNTGIGYNPVGPIKLDVQVRAPLATEWRTTLTATPPGRLEPPRAKLIGLHPEMAFALSTLAYTHTLLARASLRTLSASSGDARTAAIQTAMKHLFTAHGIHTYTLSFPPSAPSPASSNPSSPSPKPPSPLPIDLHPSTLTALASLALAEATLAAASKDDPYAAAVADDRNPSNTDWMYRGPRIEKSRAAALVRVCVKAAEYAASARGGLVGGGREEGVGRYAGDLLRTARGRAARFSAIQAEMEGRVGEAIAWLRGARKELGLKVELDEGRRKGLKGLKQSWMEKREDRKVERGGEWGLDAGRLEEARVVEVLEAKWERENSIMNVQAVPAFEPLLAALPSGRTPFAPPPFVPPALDADVLAGMQAPPDPDEAVFRGEEEDSGGEDGYASTPAGAYPGMEGEYGRSATSASYY